MSHKARNPDGIHLELCFVPGAGPLATSSGSRMIFVPIFLNTAASRICTACPHGMDSASRTA